ncbi:MAG: hypothetical protein KJ967_05865 [Elusimicrobia bacterium]|nr:hypothetical protein [Elusimicrobiota bacterium]
MCTGNTCRSVLAEGYTKRLIMDEGFKRLTALSCGTAASVSYTVPGVVVRMLAKEDIDVSMHVSTPVSRELIDASDIILVMDNSHKEALLYRFLDARKKIHLLKEYAGEKENREIPDPIGQPENVYQERAEEIKKYVRIAFEIIRKDYPNGK